MSQLQGKTVLITGAAAGIGKIMARMLLERGCRVIVWDIHQEKIEATLAEYSALGSIYGYRVDVTDAALVKETAHRVKTDIGPVDLLINNAGIVVGKYFHEHTHADIQQTMAVNAHAPMWVTQEFLADMLERDAGHICNIASSAGIVSNPKMSVYAASKWSLVGWSDSLRLEMRQLKKNVWVTTIMPYYIATGMFDGVKSRIPILQPEATARTILRAIQKNKKMLTIPGYIYTLTRISQGLFSVALFDWLAGNVLGIYKTMEHFTGHRK